MVVPDGFHVELVASEPAIMNPVAMAFDDRGRIYVTESFEYPRREPGPGRDRIKILEDKDGDGVCETVNIFAEGLNIPSGIAVGHGGVWVANAPDILFLEDTDGDDVADKKTVVVTGFGRDDTHELPNALTWGPDGYLYGLNGVFNPSTVVQNGKTWNFTCAMFRINPRTHEFDIFCEGTSNPWGIAFDHEGSAFISACVIDHLWHLTESGYYRRQGGPYPPHTFFAESIVQHKHQMAAYCGIEFLDTDAYPAKFNNKLYMGNIHGGCINSDSIERVGATYRGSPEPDFMTANDVWFMPVAQKVGPDGCLYVLDWYDRYHCYQDANADPAGVDRGHGRLYRIVHKDKGRAEPRFENFDAMTNSQLAQALHDPNIFNRQRAQLKLQERAIAKDTETKEQIQTMVLDGKLPMKTRMHALWSLVGGGEIKEKFASKLISASEPELRAWGVRTIGEQGSFPPSFDPLESLAADPDPRVRIEVAIAAPKLLPRLAPSLDKGTAPSVFEKLIKVLAHSDSDPITSRVVWQNMVPLLADGESIVVEALKEERANRELIGLAPRFAGFLASKTNANLEDEDSRRRLQTLLEVAGAIVKQDRNSARLVLNTLLEKLRNQEIQSDKALPIIQTWLSEHSSIPAYRTPGLNRWQEWNGWQNGVFQLHMMLGDEACIATAKKILTDNQAKPELRLQIILAASATQPDIVADALHGTVKQLAERQTIDPKLRDVILDLGMRRIDGAIADSIATELPKMDSTVQATIAERLCQRTETAIPLLEKVASGVIRKELISPNRIRLLAGIDHEGLKKLVANIWGTVNAESSKEREEAVQRAFQFLSKEGKGDAARGWAAFDRTCGQCHVMHGRGHEVGPNITANGRGAFDQLLVSVFNPSLVIGDAYKSVTLRTVDDEIITGLLVERTDKRTVLKLQGGKERIVLEEEIDEFKNDSKSLMPEGLENQLSPQEMADLFALLTLEKPPESKENTIISGTPESLHSR